MATKDTLQRITTFPNPVNDHAARVVAVGVVVMTLAMLVTKQWWISLPLAYGFLARVMSGPRFSPLGILATKVVAPRLSSTPKLVPGPPKRFAQGMGAVMTTVIAVASLGFEATSLATAFALVLLGAASLEGFLGFCIGCRIFALLMRAGLIPDEVCDACNNLSLR